MKEGMKEKKIKGSKRDVREGGGGRVSDVENKLISVVRVRVEKYFYLFSSKQC